MRSLNMLMILTFWYRRVWCDGTDESENAVGRFLSWSENNSMHSNPKKMQGINLSKNGYPEELELVQDIPQCRKMVDWGLLFK